MKRIFIFLLIMNCFQSFSQTVELNGGVNKNYFYHFDRDNSPHSNSSYSPDNGYQIGIGISDVEVDTFLQLRFTLNYINYGGSFNFSSGGMGGGSTFSGHVTKSVLSLGIYPLNLKIFKRIDLNLGLELSCLLSQKLTGTENWWQMGYDGNPGTGGSYNLSDQYKHFSASSYAAISARLAYPVYIGSRFSITPQIGCYYGGLSSEFTVSDIRTKSFKEYISIGLRRSF